MFFKKDIGEIVPIVRRLIPELQQIVLIGGASDLDKLNLTVVHEALKQYETEIKVLDLSGLPIQEIINQVGKLPSTSAVLYTSILVDGKGRHFVPREILKTISKAANVPSFGLLDSYLGYGIVGGSLFSLQAMGEISAKLALRVLAGESPGNIPFSDYGTMINMFDWRELQRWKISEANLPPESDIQYRPLSMWDLYQGRIIATVAVLIMETILIITLVLILRKSRRFQQELLASEQRYRIVADYAYAWEYWSAPDGSVNYISPACESITGYLPRQFSENPSFIREVIVPEDHKIWDEHDHSAIMDHAVKEIQFRIRREDGEVRWLEHSCRPVVDSQGKFLGIRASNRDITVRHQAEVKILEREKDLQKLAERLIRGQEEERRRLARELHDDLTQRLAVLAIQVGKMEQTASQGRQPQLQDFHDLRDQAVQISTDIHDISRQLHPSILDDLGLVKAIESECDRLSHREGISVTFTSEDIPDNLANPVALSLYRIIQEGFTNIVKHACADQVTISLQVNGHSICLRVQDNGIGFNATEVRKKPGLGLSSIRERVRIIHGESRITSEPDQGTIIELKVPLRQEQTTVIF